MMLIRFTPRYFTVLIVLVRSSFHYTLQSCFFGIQRNDGFLFFYIISNHFIKLLQVRYDIQWIY